MGVLGDRRRRKWVVELTRSGGCARTARAVHSQCAVGADNRVIDARGVAHFCRGRVGVCNRSASGQEKRRSLGNMRC